MKPTRILLIGISSNLGGIEAFVRDLVFNSNPKEFSFTILLEDGIIMPYQRELLNYGVRIITFPSRKRGYRRYLEAIRHIFQKNEFDVIHINLMTFSPFELVLYACKYSNAKIIVHSHNAGYEKEYFKSRIIQLYGRTRIRNCKFERIACSERAGKYLFKNKPFLVFTIGIDYRKYSFSHQKRDYIRREVGAGKDTVVIGNVASFTKPKNHGFIVKCFIEFKKMMPNSKLVLVGVGPEQRMIKELVSSLKLDHDVVFLGRRTDVGGIYSAFDVFVLPSLSESFGIALCEAQANGLPCIASYDVGNDANMFGKVIFLNTDSPKKWAKAIMSCSGKRSMVKSIPAKYNIINSNERIYNYYHELLEAKK